MIIRKYTLTFISICLFGSIVFAQHPALSKINKKDLKRYLTFISSDDLQGRSLGTKVDGLGITANYLAENAKRIGLQPGATGYFQALEMVSTKPDETNFIEALDKRGKLLIRTNKLVILKGAAETKIVEGEEIVCVGFGDSEIPKVKDKIVIVAQGNADSFNQGKSFRWDSALERTKIQGLSEMQPKAIIFITNPKDSENMVFKQVNTWFMRDRYQLKSSDNENTVPVVASLPGFADKLLGGKGKFLKYLNDVANHKNRVVKTIENKKLKLKTGSITSPVEAKNVVGMIEGSDPKLKNEYLVFLAHYDHLGVGKDGEVYNGADDNGSGTVALLGVAKAFASLSIKPKRSIVFLWVTCEEIGHFGSAYYCDNPIYPLKNTVAAINLDMVGRVYESPRDDVYKNSPKKVKDFDGLYTLSNDVWLHLTEINAEKCDELGLIPDTSLPKERFLRASDHYSFHKKGVPILNYATGYHADYHKLGDEVEKINFDKLKRVADLCFLVGLEVANLNKIEFKK